MIPNDSALNPRQPLSDGGSDSDRRFRLIVEAAPNAMVMIDQAGLIVMVNAQVERAIRLLESRTSRATGRDFCARTSPRSSPRSSRGIFHASPGAAHGRRARSVRPQEGRRRVPDRDRPEPDRDRRGNDGAVRDNRYYRAQGRGGLARESAHRLRSLAAIVEFSDDAIISNSLEGVVTSWNKSAERIFGYSASEMIGQSILRLAVPGRGGEMIAILERIKRGERVDHSETIRRRRDGSTVHVSLTVSPIYDVDNKLVGASKVARDITAAALADAALRDSQARLQELHGELLHVSRLSAMGEMASALAHELNQPLAAVSNYMKGSRRLLALEPDPNAPRIEAALDKAAEQAIRAGQIIRRLRDFVARGESERSIESISRLIEEFERARPHRRAGARHIAEVRARSGERSGSRRSRPSPASSRQFVSQRSRGYGGKCEARTHGLERADPGRHDRDRRIGYGTRFH